MSLISILVWPLLGANLALVAVMKPNQSLTPEVQSKIYLIRGQKVMLDFDLSELYQVSTRQLNQQVRRNEDRFPADFMFSLTNQEFTCLMSQIVTSNTGRGGRRKLPLAFTEQGIAMLSTVLNSQRAIDVNIAIMRTFVQLREVFFSNRELQKKIQELESKYDGKFKSVFAAIQELMSNHAVPRKRIIGLGKKDEWTQLRGPIYWGQNKKDERIHARPFCF